MADPIAELLAALAHDGKPPLTWVVRFSAYGEEPVYEAWQVSRDPIAMLSLLWFDWPARRTESLRAMRAVLRHCVAESARSRAVIANVVQSIRAQGYVGMHFNRPGVPKGVIHVLSEFGEDTGRAKYDDASGEIHAPEIANVIRRESPIPPSLRAILAVGGKR